MAPLIEFFDLHKARASFIGNPELGIYKRKKYTRNQANDHAIDHVLRKKWETALSTN